MSTATTDAPDWGPNYPSAGRQIGVAWRAQWAALADGEYHDPAELVRIGVDASGCAESTSRTLLFAAARHGLLAKQERIDPVSRRWRAWYRRAEVGA